MHSDQEASAGLHCFRAPGDRQTSSRPPHLPAFPALTDDMRPLKPARSTNDYANARLRNGTRLRPPYRIFFRRLVAPRFPTDAVLLGAFLLTAAFFTAARLAVPFLT